MQKIFILLFVAYALFSCGTTQLVEESEPTTESNNQSDQQMKVIEVAPGKLENPGSVTGKVGAGNPQGERPK